MAPSAYLFFFDLFLASGNSLFTDIVFFKRIVLSRSVERLGFNSKERPRHFQTIYKIIDKIYARYYYLNIGTVTFNWYQPTHSHISFASVMWYENGGMKMVVWKWWYENGSRKDPFSSTWATSGHGCFFTIERCSCSTRGKHFRLQNMNRI